MSAEPIPFVDGHAGDACFIGPARSVRDLGRQYHEDQPERTPGPELGDYLGPPINDAARFRADSWDASLPLLTLPEWQCRPHPCDYGDRHCHVRIWEEIDRATQQLIADHTHREWQAQERTIDTDGRAHPPDHAAHTWQGFST